jgi:putative serine protease PepD
MSTRGDDNEPTVRFPQPGPDHAAGHPAPPPHAPSQPAFSAPGGGQAPGPQQGTGAYVPSPALAPRRRRRTAAWLATGVAVVALGGAAGYGGAALQDRTSSAAGGSVASTVANVVDQGDTEAVEGSVEAVAAEVLPSVVKIDVTTESGAGSGSGIVLDTDGRILTNNHVVEGASGGTVRVSFHDGTTAEAEVLGTDPLTDTAVIRAEGVDDLVPATIGKSANLDVGQSVVAIGSPFGLDATVTSGIVSALNRPVNVGQDTEGNSTTYPAIQTDAAINPGNSGGPLVDMTGSVVGINSSIRTASSSSPYGQESQGGSIGLGFAIPIDEVLPVVEQMSNGETPTHARLGIQVTDATEDVTGALVREVGNEATASKAGLRSGDVITRIDDRHISGADSLVATIRSYRPGDEVTVTWVRDGKEMDATVALDSDEGRLETSNESQQQESPGGGLPSSPFGNPFGD